MKFKRLKFSIYKGLLAFLVAGGLVGFWRFSAVAVRPSPPPAGQHWLTDRLPVGFGYKNASVPPDESYLSPEPAVLKWKIGEGVQDLDIDLTVQVTQRACAAGINHNNSVVADKPDSSGTGSAVRSTPEVQVKCGGLRLLNGDVASGGEIAETSLLTIEGPAVILAGKNVDSSVYDPTNPDIKVLESEDTQGKLDSVASNFVRAFKRIIKEGLYKDYQEYQTGFFRSSKLDLNPDNRAGGGIYYASSGAGNMVGLNYPEYEDRGVIVVKGDILIGGDINLDSRGEFLGVVALKREDGSGGNIYFAPDSSDIGNRLELKNVALFAENNLDLSGPGANDCPDSIACRDIDMLGSVFAQGKVILGDSSGAYRRQGIIKYTPDILKNTPPGFVKLIHDTYTEIAP